MRRFEPWFPLERELRARIPIDDAAIEHLIAKHDADLESTPNIQIVILDRPQRDHDLRFMRHEQRSPRREELPIFIRPIEVEIRHRIKRIHGRRHGVRHGGERRSGASNYICFLPRG